MVSKARAAPRRSGPYLIGVDASASIAGLIYALRSLAPGGICTGVGGYFMRKAALTGKFKPEKVTTLVANWDDAPLALLERTTKVVVKRDPLNAGGLNAHKGGQIRY